MLSANSLALGEPDKISPSMSICCTGAHAFGKSLKIATKTYEFSRRVYWRKCSLFIVSLNWQEQNMSGLLSSENQEPTWRMKERFKLTILGYPTSTMFTEQSHVWSGGLYIHSGHLQETGIWEWPKGPIQTDSTSKWTNIQPTCCHQQIFPLKWNRGSTDHCCPVLMSEVAIPPGNIRPELDSASTTLSIFASPAHKEHQISVVTSKKSYAKCAQNVKHTNLNDDFPVFVSRKNSKGVQPAESKPHHKGTKFDAYTFWFALSLSHM